MSPLNVFSLVTPKLPIQCKRQPTKIFHIKTCLAHAHARKFINELLLYTKHLRLYIPNLQFLVHFLQKFYIREKNILTNSKYSTFGKHCLRQHRIFAPLKYAVVLLQIKTIYYNRRLHTVTYSRKKNDDSATKQSSFLSGYVIVSSQNVSKFCIRMQKSPTFSVFLHAVYCAVYALSKLFKKLSKSSAPRLRSYSLELYLSLI